MQQAARRNVPMMDADYGKFGRKRRGAASRMGYFGPLNTLYASFKAPSGASTTPSIHNERIRSGDRHRTIHLPAQSFSFRQRRGKLDTRAIAQIDLNRVVRETDIDTIQVFP
ncbi:hypothetical protein AC1031_022124 [Aphanomyces cochlioides]|nr:hypothetical protein AC1031_022124 [Aphanomyces cochlioides]